MKRNFITLFFLQIVALSLFSQENSCLPNLLKGQEITVMVDVVNNKIQTAGAQVINFRLLGSALHKFTVTDIDSRRIRIRQELKRIQFDFDGMGQKRKFDSNSEEDLKGSFGPFIKQLLVDKYDFEIDKEGLIRSGFTWNWRNFIAKSDDKNFTITDMLGPLLDIANHSASGPPFFRVIPAGPDSPDSLWATGISERSESYNYLMKFTAVTDSTIQLNLKTTGTCNSSLEIMGRPTNTNEKIASNGEIIYDRKTCLIKEKMVTTESNGTTEAMGGKVPINGKIKVSMLVQSGR